MTVYNVVFYNKGYMIIFTSYKVTFHHLNNNGVKVFHSCSV